jgi:hypothetical protein
MNEQEVVRVFGPALQEVRPDMESNASNKSMHIIDTGLRYGEQEGDVLLDCQVGPSVLQNSYNFWACDDIIYFSN